MVDQLFADEQVDWSDSDADGEVFWALTDRQGSVTDMVDGEARLRLHREFDSFGNITDETHYDTDGVAVSEGQAGYLDEAFAYTGECSMSTPDSKTTSTGGTMRVWAGG